MRPVTNMIENFEGAKKFVENSKRISEKKHILEYSKKNIIIPQKEALSAFVKYYHNNINYSFDYYLGGFGT